MTFTGKLCFGSDLLGFAAQLFVPAGEKDRLHVEFAAHEFAEDERDVAAAFPAGVHKNRELVRIQTQAVRAVCAACSPGKSNFGCTGMPEILIRCGEMP